MKPYQIEFIELAIKSEVLKFGEFTLKSGRTSPYFFNAGEFYTGDALAQLGRFYAQALLDSCIPFDMVFGPAYKGIPLATAVSIMLASEFTKSVPFAYNRKEAKKHGEGGSLVGAPLNGNVAIIDDVITAGTAIREVLEMLSKTPAKASVILVGLDRQERGVTQKSAIEELHEQTGVTVASIIKLVDIITYLEQTNQHEKLAKMQAYRARYGV